MTGRDCLRCGWAAARVKKRFSLAGQAGNGRNEQERNENAMMDQEADLAVRMFAVRMMMKKNERQAKQRQKYGGDG